MSVAVDWSSEAARIRSKPAAGKRGAPERAIQRVGIRWLRIVFPGSIVTAVPIEQRGMGRTEEERARYGAARKASGVLTGFFDAVALLAGPRTLLTEFKTPGGRLSDDQREIHGRARALGHLVVVADGLESLRWGVHQLGLRTIEAPGGEMRPPKVYGL